MLTWGIVMLACVGYFVNEAVRAPIIEDDKVRGPATERDQATVEGHEWPAPIRLRLAHGSPAQ